MRASRLTLKFLFLLLTAALLGACRSGGEVVFVDNGRLLREVKLFVDARDSLQAFNQGWQKAAQPLKDSVDAYMQQMGSISGAVSDARKKALEAEFQSRQDALRKFVEANQKKAGELDKTLTETAFKKANGVLEEFRSRKGYAMILGTTAGGNILAAEKSRDVTDAAVKHLNEALK